MTGSESLGHPPNKTCKNMLKIGIQWKNSLLIIVSIVLFISLLLSKGPKGKFLCFFLSVLCKCDRTDRKSRDSCKILLVCIKACMYNFRFFVNELN